MKNISTFTRHIVYIKLECIISHDKPSIENEVWTNIKYKTSLNRFQSLKEQILNSVKEKIPGFF